MASRTNRGLTVSYANHGRRVVKTLRKSGQLLLGVRMRVFV
jgi:hypothetical protein